MTTTPDIPAIRRRLADFAFRPLFVEELGWDNLGESPTIAAGGIDWRLEPVAHKRGFAVFAVRPGAGGHFPTSDERRAIDRAVARLHREHLLVFADEVRGEQIWFWTRREPGEPIRPREFPFRQGQTGQGIAERLAALAVSLEEDLRDELTLPDVSRRVRGAMDVEKVTKKFYDRYQKEHAAFEQAIAGIPLADDQRWYASVMLNRLMFVYFVQKKGFLDGDQDYLRHKLEEVRQRRGTGQFLSFYRAFLRRLFHEGLAAPEADRDPELDRLIGDVPYLNGGLFDVHALESAHDAIDIPDAAFAALFAFFDAYQWRLDTTGRADRPDNEIDPDVLGYIFEKYINQKQMGAYYTKEDITGYIGRNTILPAVFDTARPHCPIAFEPGGALWSLLRDDPDRYIYPAVRRGTDQPLPPEIAAGLDDVTKRGGWNAPAAEGFALPTETWREHVARRRRYEEMKAKLAAGEVSSIDDLVTLNLDIERFALDAIEEAEGPELVRAFWRALRETTVLDPTCGSGAFLFAALTILQPLYAACLERMRAFLDDLERLAGEGERTSPLKYKDFRETLDRIAMHPNEDYFVLKSIILDNLYGVDIMEEAVEICKLRLFLKLAAQVERVDQIEPLPDIDFNVRAGNTLVGFATYDDVKRAVAGDGQGKLDLFGDMARIDERAEIAARAFARFRDMQTTHGMDPAEFRTAKTDVAARLVALRDELDRYLAAEYGVAVDGTEGAAFAAWKGSHQPFHWFVEFYGIMHAGGFDAIVGNPPYIELREVKEYRLHRYTCAKAGNLYAVVLERCESLTHEKSRQGFIVPVSSISTERYAPLQELLTRRDLVYSAYDDRPSRLFDGLEHIRLTIHLLGKRSPDACLYSSNYNKWSKDERAVLFDKLSLTSSRAGTLDDTLPKLSSSIERGIMDKIDRQQATIGDFVVTDSPCVVYYSRKVGYFLQVLDFVPTVIDGEGRLRDPSEFKTIGFRDAGQRDAVFLTLNSSLFYWFVTVMSDCRHLNRREVVGFPLDVTRMVEILGPDLLERSRAALSESLQEQSEFRRMKFKHDHLQIQCIFPKRSKTVLDDFERQVASYYGFTPEELDFIINYDIKYRMGRDGGAGDEA